MSENEVEKDWIFSWGYGQAFPNRFIIIRGTYGSARKEMVDRFGIKWSFQYPIEKREDLEKHGMRELV